MRARILTVAGLLFGVIMAGLTCDTASAVGPLRRRIAQRRNEQRCECKYQQDVCSCHQIFPGTDPASQASLRNCLRLAGYDRCDCLSPCSCKPSCQPPCSPCGQQTQAQVQTAKTLAAPAPSCHTIAQDAYNQCKANCSGSDTFCHNHCDMYRRCVLSGCLDGLSDCENPFPPPAPSVPPPAPK
jgi:hypothetical protein